MPRWSWSHSPVLRHGSPRSRPPRRRRPTGRGSAPGLQLALIGAQRRRPRRRRLREVDVEQHDPGWVAGITANRGSTSSASPTTSTPVSSVRPISAWTPVRNIRWSSTSTTRLVVRALGGFGVLGHWLALLGTSSSYLGASAGHRTQLARTAVALHPAHDGFSHADPVARAPHPRRTRPPVPDEHQDRAAVDHRETWTATAPLTAYLAALTIASRAACIRAASDSSSGQRRPDVDLEGHRVVSSAPGRRPAQGQPRTNPRRRVPGGRAIAEDLLLGPRQPGHRLRVLGVALDERERLQDRVMDVRGQLGPLLGTDAFAPLLGVTHVRAGAARDRPQDEAGERGQPGSGRWARRATSGVEATAHADPVRTRTTPMSARRPAATAPEPGGAGGVGPPAQALGVIALPPEHGDPDGDRRRPHRRGKAQALPATRERRRTHGHRPDAEQDEGGPRSRADGLSSTGAPSTGSGACGTTIPKAASLTRPTPLAKASSTKPIRTHTVGTPRWSPRPAGGAADLVGGRAVQPRVRPRRRAGGHGAAHRPCCASRRSAVQGARFATTTRTIPGRPQGPPGCPAAATRAGSRT